MNFRKKESSPPPRRVVKPERLTNDQMHMIGVAGGYNRKVQEVLAKKMGAVTCRHKKKAMKRFMFPKSEESPND